VYHLDLLFRVRDFRRLETLQVANIFQLEIFYGGFMTRIEAMAHGRKFIIRGDSEGVGK